MDSFLIILGMAIFVLGVYNLFLHYKISSQPSNNDLEQDIDDLYLQVEKLQNDLSVYVNDVYDKVEGILSPMSKRIASRQAREKEKDINNADVLNKSGLISPQRAREYGFIK